MEASACSDGGNGMNGSIMEMDFGFGFNNPKFSDRVLRLEISTDPSEPQLDKPTRRKVLGRQTSFDSAEEPEQPLPQHNKRSSNSSVSSHSINNVHICSLVLAAKSPVFYKMFSNGMRESEQQVVTLSIQASEEVALLDFLQFLYTNKLQANMPTHLLKVLIFADRYQAVSCVRCCVKMLSSFPMTSELAMSIKNLPSSVLAGNDSHLRVLVDAATCFLTQILTLDPLAALKLPLESIENILSLDTLEVFYEDQVYDFVLQWARTHYKDPSERRQHFSSRLCQLVRFPYMSCEKLETVLQCEELDHGDATKIVVEALFLKANHLPRMLAARPCPERAYKCRPVKVTMLDSPYQQCIVYLDLKKEECEKLGQIWTQMFHVGKECFNLVIQGNSGNAPFKDTFAIYPCRSSMRSTIDTVKVKCELAVTLKSTDEYVRKQIKSLMFKNLGFAYGRLHLDEPWDSFMGEDSEYFIDGVLYVRFTLTLQ